MKLLVVIPALNEEAGIEAIIRRCLDARTEIIAHSPVEQVEFTVVSDGSTDNTAEIARGFLPYIHLIEFAENRGYGAAIKEAWLRSDADLLGFIDADGTCDPLFFAELCRELCAQDVDVMLGCRRGANSQMPHLRRAGNSLFATILTVMSSTRVRDTASGMRVVRRSSLRRLMPLPDGLHFTPAMSARAMLEDGLRMAEIDMPYEERTGRSKLSVVRDGARFLSVILTTVFLYRPSRLLNAAAVVCAAIGVLLMVNPTVHYLTSGQVVQWMIYRFVVGQILATAALLFISGGYLASRAVTMSLAPNPRRSRPSRWVAALMTSRWFWAAPIGMMIAGVALVAPSILSLIHTGRVLDNWSRFIVMSTLLTAGLILTVTKLVDTQLSMIERRLSWLGSAEQDIWLVSDSKALQAETRSSEEAAIEWADTRA